MARLTGECKKVSLEVLAAEPRVAAVRVGESELSSGLLRVTGKNEKPPPGYVGFLRNLYHLKRICHFGIFNYLKIQNTTQPIIFTKHLTKNNFSYEKINTVFPCAYSFYFNGV
jgi:hypothetical protein